MKEGFVMKLPRIQRVHSKWVKTELLMGNRQLRSYVPETQKLTVHTLETMLNRYGMVYVKPDQGSHGKGVMRVERVTNGYATIYQYQIGQTVKKFYTLSAMYADLKDNKTKKLYLVQKGIDLLTYNKRRFDIRVMVQKNPQDEWVATGLIGRVSHPNNIVTNYHSGGTPMGLKKLLESKPNKQDRRELRALLRKIGVQTAEHFERKYPRIKELGLDIALDQNHHPWILEVNTAPDPYIFKKLKDPSVFRTVYRYFKAYGGV